MAAISFVLPIISALFAIAGIFGFCLFVFVLIKLDKALNIWLEQNKKD